MNKFKIGEYVKTQVAENDFEIYKVVDNTREQSFGDMEKQTLIDTYPEGMFYESELEKLDISFNPFQIINGEFISVKQYIKKYDEITYFLYDKEIHLAMIVGLKNNTSLWEFFTTVEKARDWLELECVKMLFDPKEH